MMQRFPYLADILTIRVAGTIGPNCKQHKVRIAIADFNGRHQSYFGIVFVVKGYFKSVVAENAESFVIVRTNPDHLVRTGYFGWDQCPCHISR